MIIRSKRDKYIRYFKKYLNVKLSSLSLNKIVGRWKGPKILITSIPKSGTHLLEEMLENYPYMRSSAQKTIMGWEDISESDLKKIRNIRNGEILNSHLPAHNKLVEVCKENNIKVLLMIRDPRDVIISNMRYVLDIDRTHITHKYISELGVESKIIEKLIIGEKGILSPIREILEKYEPWLEKDWIKVVRYEDLVSGDGKENSRVIQEINEIASYLGIESNLLNYEKICGVIGNGKRGTYRKGKSGGWVSHFSTELRLLFESKVKGVIEKFGYEL